MATILITTSSFGKNEPELLQILRNHDLEYHLNPLSQKLSESEITELIEKHQPIGMIAGVEPLTRKVLEKAKNLKVISRAGIGVDSVDLQAAKDLGIVVTNTPDAPTIPVAELVMSMILSLLRSMHISDASIRQGSWKRPMGRLLQGKTVGIIGCGRVGSYLAGLLSSFGCTILGCDPFVNKSDNFSMANLEEILSDADIISLHIPYNQENHHFINAKRIQSMKKGALLINTARGGLIDETAAYEALKSGKIAGLGLDAYECEPVTDSPLVSMDNVISTPHTGAHTNEAISGMGMMAVENLIAVLSGKDCAYIIK